MNKKDLPQGYIPSVKEAEWFLNYWKELLSYSNHESSLNKLFKKLCAKNDNIEDILIKCSSLNDFYSTNIFDIHTVAQHILSLNIDERLERGDYSLVDEIAHVEVNGKDHFFYSFATKYCSHHQPEKYAIYDNYVEKVLISMNKRKPFTNFKREDLKDYSKYMSVIRAFQQRFGLVQYTIKQLDQYLWQLGKWYFNNYGLIYKYYNREDENPYPVDDVRNKFWYGEMMFVTNVVKSPHQSVGYWKEEGKKCLKDANDDIRKLAARLTPEQFGVVVYISSLFGKGCPYDGQEWILEY
ncbi:MAG: hypothetical protein J5814_02800 [Bacteroidaceae bacterium]|nr:hypothetical protein [Bacteroidaceae bacterium]